MSMACVRCKSGNVLEPTEIWPVHWCQECGLDFNPGDAPLDGMMAVCRLSAKEAKERKASRLLEAKVDAMSDDEVDAFLADSGIDMAPHMARLDAALNALREAQP